MNCHAKGSQNLEPSRTDSVILSKQVRVDKQAVVDIDNSRKQFEIETIISGSIMKFLTVNRRNFKIF